MKLQSLVVLTLLGLVVACSSAEERAAKYLEKAQSSFEAGDMVKAKLDARNTLQIEPQNADARFLLARIAETKLISEPDTWRDMMGNLQRVLELRPDHVEARVKIIQLYLRFLGSSEKGQVLELIREQLDLALFHAPENLSVQNLKSIVEFHEASHAGDDSARDAALADAQAKFDADPKNLLITSFLTGVYAASEPDRALNYLDTSLAAQPNPALRILKIGMLQSLNRVGDAESEYIKLVDEHPENTEIRFGLAKFYVDTRQPEKAEQLMRDIAEANPEDVDSRLRLIKFVGRFKSLDEAESLVTQFIAEQPDEWQYQFVLSEIYVSQERSDDAEALFESIVEKAGDTQPGLDARNRLARLRMLQGRNTEAEEYMDAVLEVDAANPEALMMKAGLQLSAGDFDSAISGLRTVLRADPASRGGLLLMARAHSLAGNKNLSKESYQKLIRSHPDSAEGRRELARLLMRDRQWEEARGVLLGGVKYFPRDLELTRMLVDVLIRVEDWQAAQVQSDRLLEIEETRALGHYLQGRIYQSSGDMDNSVEAFKRSIELEPKAIEPLTSLVRSYVMLEQNDQAEAFLKDFMQEQPKNVHGQTLLAEIYARAGNLDRAIIENDKAIALNSRWVPAYRNLIGLHLLSGELNAAERASDGALEVMPENPDLRMLRATVYERQSRWNEAIDIYRVELQRNPDLLVAVNNYAALVADHKQDEINKALELAQRFRNTDNPIFLDTYGWLLYRTGDFEGAVKVLEEAVAGAPQVPQLHYHLGMAYFELDRLDVAKRELQAALAAKQPYTGMDKARETLELL